MKSIYLIRHGRQNDARCNVNVELSEEGHRQAKLVANRLKNYSIQQLYSSHLIRAVETAEDISDVLELPVQELIGMEEIDFGELTGHTAEYVKEHFGDFRRERNEHISDLAYPGGECGADVIRRVFPVLMELIHESDETIAIVSHGGVIRALIAHVLGLDQRYKLRFAKDLENCSITHLLYEREKNRFFLERLNDYAHLEPYPELLRAQWDNLVL